MTLLEVMSLSKFNPSTDLITILFTHFVLQFYLSFFNLTLHEFIFLKYNHKLCAISKKKTCIDVKQYIFLPASSISISMHWNSSSKDQVFQQSSRHLQLSNATLL